MILTARHEELSQEQELHKKLAFDIIRSSVENGVGLTQIAVWTARVINTILPQHDDLDLSSIKTVMVVICERVEAISPGNGNPFSNPGERARWDAFRRKYAEVVGEISIVNQTSDSGEVYSPTDSGIS